MTPLIASLIAATSTVTDAQLDALLLEADAIQEVVVEAKADARRETAVILERKRAAAVSDAISAQEISRTPDSNAGDAVKRVVSATIVDGRYVLVRGLGGRYVTTLLNGVALPSPEPDEQAVPLDLFPAALLSNLKLAKSYGAELPGTFGGGALLIETSSFPASFEAKVKLSGSADSVTTFRDSFGYQGGTFDYLGFEDGSRGLPALVPGDRPVAGSGLDADQVERIGESFSNVWSARDATAVPNLSLGAHAGDTLRLGGDRFGWLGALSFNHKAFVRRAEVAKARISEDRLEVREQLQSTTAQESGVLGALLNFAYEPSDHDQIALLGLYSHHGESRTVRVTGVSETDGERIDDTRLQFLERQLAFLQVTGAHSRGSARDVRVEWQVNGAVTGRDEPDTRDTVYTVLANGNRRFKTGPGSGERFFSELTDLAAGGSAQIVVPISSVKLSAGGSIQRSSRVFEARRFRFDFAGTDPAVLFAPPEGLFTAENIGDSLILQERTLPADTYDASLLVVGGFLSADATFLDPVRVVAGARVEHSVQSLEPGSPFAISAMAPGSVDRSHTGVLPSLNLVWSMSPEMNLRAAYSYTLARPQFRELAPFLYFDFARRRSSSGNPDLVETRIHNADLRWEWFFGKSELLAASVFAKQFVDPIEQVIAGASQGDLSFANTPGAASYGAELEARTSLGFIADVLEDFRAGANVSWIYSRIQLDPGGPQTNRERPLQGQSPYVVNLSLGYADAAGRFEVSALYNVHGRRIAEVGFETLPDVYEQPFHRVDISAGWSATESLKLKLAATNILNQSVVLDQGDITVLRYRPGVGGMASVEWSP